uniref:Gypsy retrotransposon integrase-like protein 1 n=1 Tax=Leptobrachium leishanense TaxID=445787 RepID=A0A8C5PEH0_9ANUR
MCDIFATLAGGQQFTKLDLKHAYLQLPVHPESRPYLTINTHKGLFQYNRMVFGIAPAPAIWQRTMDELLAGVPGTQCLLDDMLITGRTEREHRQNVQDVLQILMDHGLKVNINKCEFLKDHLEFCGHVIDKTGLHTTDEKVKALIEAPIPRNVTQLHSYLGLLNYYNKFLPNLAHTLFPLHRLLEKQQQWKWTESCSAAFKASKELIRSSRVLVHYDLSKPLSIACDASPYGLGAVLSHSMPDGTDRPVAFASRSLTPAERNYSQIDKEALAITWALKKFHFYIYGGSFTLLTDHKPLLAIFNPTKSISQTTAARLQRYALLLGAYQYEIRYRPHDKHTNSDAFSRHPLPLSTNYVRDSPPSIYFSKILTAVEIAQETSKDADLQEVLSYVQHGWPFQTSPRLRPFHSRNLELSVREGCLLWGERVIVPPALQKPTLQILHEGHPGIVRMKQKARGHVWWPTLDEDIGNYVAACSGCAQAQRCYPRGTVQPW